MVLVDGQLAYEKGCLNSIEVKNFLRLSEPSSVYLHFKQYAQTFEHLCNLPSNLGRWASTSTWNK